MREIKFRVWDIESKIWIGNYSNDWVGTGIGNVAGPDKQPWKCMSLKGEIMSNDNMGGFVDSNQEDYVIQQFTGLKDKDGKDIYEGDILESGFKTKTYYSIIFRHGSFYYNGDSISKYIIIEETMRIAYLKIVGNIFENPELLK